MSQRRKLLSAAGLMLVGSVLIVFGANAGYEETRRTGEPLAYVFYLLAVFGAAVAAAGVYAFRKAGRERARE